MAGTSPFSLNVEATASQDDPSNTSSDNPYDNSAESPYTTEYTTPPDIDRLNLPPTSPTKSAHKSSSFSSISMAYGSMANVVGSSFNRDIAKGWHLILTLLLLTFLTGMQDCATGTLFDGFASNYTGDLVYSTINLTLSARHKGVVGWYHNVKFLTFMITAVAVGQTAHWAGPRTKRWACFSSLLQAVCLTMGAVVLLTLRGSELMAVGRAVQLVMIGLICVGGTAQIVMTRTLDREITSALFTGPTLDVLSDPKFFDFCRHPTRYPTMYKRTLMIACAFTGAFIAAFIQEYVGAEVVLVVSSSLRIVVVVLLALAPTERPKGSDVELGALG